LIDKVKQCQQILGQKTSFNKSGMIACHKIWKTAGKQEKIEISNLFRAQLHLATEEQTLWTHRLMQGLIK